MTECRLHVTLRTAGILTTDEFLEWIGALGNKRRALIDNRLDRIRESGHFGDLKALGDGLYELRWKNGTRAYFSYVAGDAGRMVLMLWGGDKNGQGRDIAKARKFQGRAGA
ncbi:MAG: type II toxin-antitoxin system RelE/ParE family toxin [Elusimicrobia bacterium]|nr:type II toxin-antitoxin system RelE/ParE family toxin [Elusimicrobiota bacterium]